MFWYVATVVVLAFLAFFALKVLLRTGKSGTYGLFSRPENKDHYDGKKAASGKYGLEEQAFRLIYPEKK